MEQAKFTYSPLDKALEKQTKKQVVALKSVKRYKKEDDELKQIKSIFPKNLLNNLIKNKVLEILKLQNVIKSDEKIINQNAEKIMITVNLHYSYLNQNAEKIMITVNLHYSYFL